SLAFSKTGLLASASQNTVRIWRSSDWAEVLAISNHSAPVAFSADGSLLAASLRSGIRILKSGDGGRIAEFPNASPPFAFSPADTAFVANAKEGIALWETAGEGPPSRILENSAGILNVGWIRERPALAFSPDGRFIVAARNVFRSGGAFGLELWE